MFRALFLPEAPQELVPFYLFREVYEQQRLHGAISRKASAVALAATGSQRR